ncbi:MAG TPA: CcdC protein domain-containing protein [Caulobacteraceae bacterium]|jgi:membrane protein CcdC involved in cytochrome C biogenesis|nr:CcdC protein domain-containing protein [Caulobacteraceae bacterium]
MHPDARLLSYLVMALAAAGVLALRMRRLSRARPLRLERLWIAPALLIVAMALLLVQAPPRSSDWPWLALALAIGGGLGWVRGGTMAIAVDEKTHALNVRASPVAILFLVGLVVIRTGLRGALVGNGSVLHLSTALVTDVFLMFAVGLLGMQRLEMAIRARRLLAVARAGSDQAVRSDR